VWWKREAKRGLDEIESFLSAGYIEPLCARQLEELGARVVNVRPAARPEEADAKP